MRSDRLSFAMALIMVLVIPGVLSAGMVPPEDVIAFQGLTVDMLYASINSGMPDRSSILTYSASFDQTGGNGTFGGSYLGAPISGALTETVSGDPMYIDAGMSTDNLNNSIEINVEFIPTGNGGYTMEGTVGLYGWDGTVIKSMMGDYVIYSGSVSTTPKTSSIFQFLINTKTGALTSIFQWDSDAKGLQTYYVNSGDINKAPGVGMMNIKVATTPEPPALVLMIVPILIGLGPAIRSLFRAR